MKRVVLVLLAVAGIAGGLTLSAGADGETVDTTVSPMFIGISVAPSLLDYGSLETGTSGNLPTPALFTVTNAGTENVDLTIRGANTTDWTLASTTGPNQYRHNYGTDSGVTPFTPLSTSDLPLWSGLVANPDGIQGSFDVFLALDMPTTTSSFDTQHATVTIVASASTP